jgi:hypothetical protein
VVACPQGKSPRDGQRIAVKSLMNRFRTTRCAALFFSSRGTVNALAYHGHRISRQLVGVAGALRFLA